MMRTPRRKVVVGAVLFLLTGVTLAQDVARPPAEQLTARAGVALIRFYQQHLHPYTSHFIRCRHHPTCSRYGVEALERKGAVGVVDIGERLYECSRMPAPPRAKPAPAALEVSASATPVVSLALLQSNEDAAAGAACALGLLFMILTVVAVIGTWIGLLVFVVRDAKNRGTENPVLWLILIFFTHIIGLIIYFLARPAGNLVACEHCKNKKLQYARTCPHCGNVDPRAAAQPAGPPPPPAPPQ
ncbi:MAG: membrane protein insertion efficiency factor YidD [Candidatus Acidiferrales bacterium]